MVVCRSPFCWLCWWLLVVVTSLLLYFLCCYCFRFIFLLLLLVWLLMGCNHEADDAVRCDDDVVTTVPSYFADKRSFFMVALECTDQYRGPSEIIAIKQLGVCQYFANIFYQPHRISQHCASTPQRTFTSQHT